MAPGLTFLTDSSTIQYIVVRMTYDKCSPLSLSLPANQWGSKIPYKTFWKTESENEKNIRYFIA